MRSLQSKILILFIFLLLIVQTVSFYLTYQANQQLDNTQLNNRIESAKKLFRTQFDNRSYYLAAFAETAAKDYGLKSVLNEDRKSFLVALNNHRKRINSDIAIAIDSQGEILAELVTYLADNGDVKVKIGDEQGQAFPLPSERYSQEQAQLVELSGQLYQLGMAPIKSGSRVVGWLGFGYLINTQLAKEFAELTDVNIAFLVGEQSNVDLIASSRGADAIEDIEQYLSVLQSQQADYIFNTLPLGEVSQQPLSVLLYQSKADVLAQAGVEWPQLTAVIAMTLLLSVTGAVGIARSITSPIKRLLAQVNAITHGNYDGAVEVDGSIELRKLSNEFNSMTKAIVSREETISFQAFHDPLSHLPNRNSLLKALEARQQAGEQFLVLQLCVLGAEEVKDTLGYKVGDQLVIEVANRILKCNLNLSCYHLGAENFVLLAEQQPAEELVSKVLSELNMRCQYENVELDLQFAVGGADSSQINGGDASELLQKTNVALQHAKKEKIPYQHYQTQFDINAMERLFLTNSLKQAIELNELVLHYQPKLSLNNMTISHVEALVRWHHPEKGLIPPDAFISIAEKTGQMAALTRWVTTTAVRQYVAWREQGVDIKVAINISAENIKDKSYADFVIDLKEQFHIVDDAITLEVTEDAVVGDISTATEILCYLREHGFKLSIDDYGTGYSSLAQLKHLPVQELKVDRSFVQHLADDKSDKIIVLSTIELAHNMGLTVVAEGIEDETTLKWLAQQDCELAQGYFISRPLPVDAFDQWLENTTYQVKQYEE